MPFLSFYNYHYHADAMGLKSIHSLLFVWASLIVAQCCLETCSTKVSTTCGEVVATKWANCLLATSWPDCTYNKIFTGVMWPKHKLLSLLLTNFYQRGFTSHQTHHIPIHTELTQLTHVQQRATASMMSLASARSYLTRESQSMIIDYFRADWQVWTNSSARPLQQTCIEWSELSDSSWKPISFANFVASSPTSKVCFVFSRTFRATPIAFFTLRKHPTPPTSIDDLEKHDF